MFGEVIGASGAFLWVFLGIIAVVAGIWAYRNFWQKRNTSQPEEKQPQQKASDTGQRQSEAETKDPRFGGNYKCLCFRTIDGVAVADFTTIPKPIGEMYQFDPSCPITGNGYIVKEDKKGDIVDYDPRQVKYVLEESPEYAYFAISWDIVKHVFFAPINPFKSTSVWFAAVMIVVLFVSSLAVLG